MKSKLNEYVKVAKAAQFGESHQGLQEAEAGKIPMHKNPANGYRLFRREELEQFLNECAMPYTPQSQKQKPQ